MRFFLSFEPRHLGFVAFAIGVSLAFFEAHTSTAQEFETQALSSESSRPGTSLSDTGSHHRLQVAAGVHHFDYQEEPPPPRKSTESGLLPSAMLGYRYDDGASQPLFLARMEGSFAVSTQYQGTDQTGRHPISASTLNQFLEIEAEVATPALRIEDRLGARAYAGAGYHYWRRGDEANDTGAYREDYQWPLAIAGALFQSQLTNRMGIDLDLSARWQLLGTMKIFLSEINGALQDTTVHLGNRLGFKAQLPVNYRIFRQTSLLVSPWLELSSIGQGNPVAVHTTDGSDTGMALNEPSSRTLQYGSLIGVSLGL